MRGGDYDALVTWPADNSDVHHDSFGGIANLEPTDADKVFYLRRWAVTTYEEIIRVDSLLTKPLAAYEHQVSAALYRPTQLIIKPSFHSSFLCWMVMHLAIHI
jgi:hypothetical protein